MDTYEANSFNSLTFEFYLDLFALKTESKEFVLIISNKNTPIKTYQFDGWRFVETAIQFTGGSFGTGISKMRTHKLNDEFLVIGNTNKYLKKIIRFFK